jgi:MFS family permease
MRTAELHDARRVPRAKGQLRAGLSYVRSRPELMVPIVLVFLVGTFGLNFQITLALVVKEVFHKGPSSYGLLTSMLAVGSLLGALTTARRSALPRQRTLIGAGVAFGLLEVLLGVVPSYAVMAVLLVPTGAAVLIFTTTANASVQLAAAPEMRGRVMALYVLVFLGGTPIGAPLLGALTEVLGARSSLLIGGAVSALGCLLGGWYLARLRDRAQADARVLVSS